MLDAKVNEYITIARRKGSDWYVGTITNHAARDIKVPLSFLPAGSYTADVYSDASDVNIQPNHLTKQTKTITSKDVITLHVAAGGGEVMRIVMNH